MRIVTFLLIFASLCHCFTSNAQAIYDPVSVPNNKMGVHILHPSEIDVAAKLVNSNGGDWGYITVPIQPVDRDLIKWQEFMKKCLELHLIPIIRITTIPTGGTWDSAQDTDLVDFANFLNELEWPTENRYIILFNEVNQSREWGGVVDPRKYTDIVKNARTIFKERSEHFFLLGPALDDALPDSTTSMSAKRYISAMHTYDNAVWSYFDGFSFHSYPNPGFSQPPRQNTFPGITSYNYLFTQYKLANKPVFITETGWDQTKVSESKIVNYWNTAWDIWSRDTRVTAITPFILNGGEAFPTLSLTTNGGALSVSGLAIERLSKIAGAPKPPVNNPIPDKKSNVEHLNNNPPKTYQSIRALRKLENIIRIILGLAPKQEILLNQHKLLVELAQTPKQWEKGLSDRQELSGIDGMLFIFPQYHIPVFWMKNTKIPLDIIWIKDNVVVDITKEVPVPQTEDLPTYSPIEKVNIVLEVPAGWSKANSVQIGDLLTIN
ncbi:MAG: DUF192 domain-containing protein [Candidatus Moraniibacteriota bacterium]|nr:MAG: DUF192 domain-containing protein [Candidatus Moranbacteria bacterium]